MARHFIGRGISNTQRFMVSLQSPEGRAATFYVDPTLSFGNGDPAITAWISIEPDGNPFTESEYDAACLEEEALDARLMSVALSALETHGNTYEGVIETLRGGLSLIDGTELTTADVLASIAASEKRLAAGDADIPELNEAPEYVPQYEIDEKTSQYRLF